MNCIEHAKEVRKKLTGLVRNTMLMAGKRWGFGEDMRRAIYEGVVAPIAMYGAGIWGKRAQDTRVRRQLAAAQRPFLLTITRAFRTTPTVALTVLAGIVPLAHQAEMEYKKRRHLKRDCCKDREMDRSKWVHTGVRHKVLDQIGSGEETTEGVMQVDASRREDRVGIGIVWHGEEGDKERWEYRMKDGTPIDVAEEAAIWLACRKLQETECGGTIVTDVEGVLQRLRRFEPKGRIAEEVHQIIWEQMNRGHPIRIRELG
ncbi:hypothetical protein Trydic_g8434 [Trypoxylus dichotomus]